MLRSLFAGISGLRVNQTMLDVTGNNIANANTVGFKSSSTVFQDTLSRCSPRARPRTPPRPRRHATRSRSASACSSPPPTQLQPGLRTRPPAGHRPDDPGRRHLRRQAGNEQLYTRAGAFTFDENGNLVTPGGGRVQGYDVRRDRRRTTGGIGRRSRSTRGRTAPRRRTT